MKNQSINNQFICINSNCQRFGVKIFHQSQRLNHKDCQGWVVQLSELKHLLQLSINGNYEQNYKNIASNKNKIEFNTNPIKSLFQIRQLFYPKDNIINLLDDSTMDEQINNSVQVNKKRLDPLQILKKQFIQLKARIQNELQKVYKQVQSRILKVKQVQEKTIKQIKKVIQFNSDIFIISQLIVNSKVLKQYKDFCFVADSFTLKQQSKIEKELFKISQSIQIIGNSFWNTQIPSIKRQKRLIQKAHTQLQKFHNDQSLHPSVKIQNLQRLFQAKTIQPHYSLDKSQIWVHCWICNNQLFGFGKNIKQRKASAYGNLTDHVTQFHNEQISSKFLQQVVKHSTHKLTYSQLISQIQQKQYKQFIIIDRQNMSKGMLQLVDEKFSDQILMLDVVSSQNQKIAVGKYISAMSQGKDAADILMVMVIYAIIMSGYYRFTCNSKEMKKPKIILVTKDHFAQTFQHILTNQFGVDIQVVK